MTTFKHFEEMHAWQSARELVRMIYDLTNLPDFNRDFPCVIKSVEQASQR